LYTNQSLILSECPSLSAWQGLAVDFPTLSVQLLV
jgi:hypothetical protein